MDTQRELSLTPQQYQKQSFCFPYSDLWALPSKLSKMLVLAKRSCETYIYGYIYTQSLSEIQIYPVFLFAKSGNPKSEHYLQILTGKKILM